jgi:hypothetical protein
MTFQSNKRTVFAGLVACLAAVAAMSLAGCAGKQAEQPAAAHATAGHESHDTGTADRGDDDAAIRAERAKLSPEDQQLVAAQEWCVVNNGERLGSMGPPVKVMVKGQPVFLCCKGCEKKALANPDRTLAKVAELKAKAKGEAAHGGPKAETPKGDDKAHAAHGGHDHAGSALMVQTEPAQPVAGKPTGLKLMIHGPGGAVIKEFAVVHEQKVHLIIVRDGLDTFAHLHPNIDADGTMTTTYDFPTGGTYLLFADHQPAGGSQSTAQAQVKVTGETPPAPALTPNVPGKVVADGLQAEVTITGGGKAGETMISFALADDAGQPVSDLQPYMGAMGHLVVISSDGTQYVHAHPAESHSATKNVVKFMAHIPTPGLYKGWGQFRRTGEVRVVPFELKVG